MKKMKIRSVSLLLKTKDWILRQGRLNYHNISEEKCRKMYVHRSPPQHLHGWQSRDTLIISRRNYKTQILFPICDLDFVDFVWSKELLPQAAVQCFQFHMTLRSCPGLLQDSSWAAAQPLSTSSCVNTRVYSPLHNLGSESPRRKLIHCSWRMSWPIVPCHRAPHMSPCLHELPLLASAARPQISPAREQLDVSPRQASCV